MKSRILRLDSTPTVYSSAYIHHTVFLKMWSVDPWLQREPDTWGILMICAAIFYSFVFKTLAFAQIWKHSRISNAQLESRLTWGISIFTFSSFTPQTWSCLKCSRSCGVPHGAGLTTLCSAKTSPYRRASVCNSNVELWGWPQHFIKWKFMFLFHFIH